MADHEISSVLAHFTKKIGQKITEYATDVAFRWSRYIFTWREKRQQYGHCTHCKKEFRVQGLKHNSIYECPRCSSECIVKASGISRKKMVDQVYFVYYEKSVINPQAITARGIYAVRDYRGDFRKVETLFEPKAMYVFEPGSSVMIHRPHVYYSFTRGFFHNWSSTFNTTKSILSECDTSMANIPCYCSEESIRKAVAGTPFQYSTWENYTAYTHSDMVKFFDLYARYPCIEYLTKLGMSKIVEEKLLGNKTYGVVNWRAKNPLKVLRMTKQEMKNLREVNIEVTPWVLYLWRLSEKDGSNLRFHDLARLSAIINENRISDLKQVLEQTTLRKVDAYLTRQLDKKDVYERYLSYGQILSAWNDYIADCTKLGLDLSREAVLFPSNLYRAHQNTIKQIKVKEDKALRAKIAARSKALEKFRFEAKGFLLRPATDSKELIEEGKALHHCVGTYASRYAKGETDLFVLRRVEEPDKPFYTMEIRNGSIIQCRGLNNCVPTDDVKDFIDIFTVKKLLTKKRTRVEVAV